MAEIRLPEDRLAQLQQAMAAEGTGGTDFPWEMVPLLRALSPDRFQHSITYLCPCTPAGACRIGCVLKFRRVRLEGGEVAVVHVGQCPECGTFCWG
jgi:hypothetical protein